MNPPNPYAANRLTVDGMEVFSLEDAAHAIKDMLVRGAPLIEDHVGDAFNRAVACDHYDG